MTQHSSLGDRATPCLKKKGERERCTLPKKYLMPKLDKWNVAREKGRKGRNRNTHGYIYPGPSCGIQLQMTTWICPRLSLQFHSAWTSLYHPSAGPLQQPPALSWAKCLCLCVAALTPNVMASGRGAFGRWGGLDEVMRWVSLKEETEGLAAAKYESAIQCYCDKSQYDTSTNQ